MKKIKLDQKHIFLYIAIAVISCILIYFIYQAFSSTNENGNPGDIIIDPLPNEQMKIDLVEYEVYDLEELNFRFIIAKLRFQSNQTIDLSLSNFKTSENVLLSDTDSYLTQMTEKSLYVGRKQVVFEIKGEPGEIIVNLFIPIKNKNTQNLVLELPLKEDNKITFDLSQYVQKDASDLAYQADDVITDGNNYSLTVSSAFEITGEVLYNNEIEESYPSTAELHAFYLDIQSLSGEPLKIEDAKYIVKGTNNEFHALTSTYATEKRTGILGKEITSESNGCLFFMTLNPDREPINYSGDLYIKIEGIDYWIKIQVEL